MERKEQYSADVQAGIDTEQNSLRPIPLFSFLFSQTDLM